MATYNKQQLALIANETGFLRDNLEKVIRLTDILRFFEQHELLSRKLALKGGTAINLTIFQMPRLSVDIDLDYCNDCGREEMMSERSVITSVILSYMNTQGYILTSGSKSPQAIYTLHAVQSIQFRQIRANLIPVLRKKDHFDFEEAKDKVVMFISNLLSFTTKETMFVDKFNNGTYCPELLFEDENILSRIRKHPMAIWKTITHDS